MPTASRSIPRIFALYTYQCNVLQPILGKSIGMASSQFHVNSEHALVSHSMQTWMSVMKFIAHSDSIMIFMSLFIIIVKNVSFSLNPLRWLNYQISCCCFLLATCSSNALITHSSFRESGHPCLSCLLLLLSQLLSRWDPVSTCSFSDWCLEYFPEGEWGISHVLYI